MFLQMVKVFNISVFHKTSFVDILQMTLSNKVPILSSFEDSLYIYKNKRQIMIC